MMAAFSVFGSGGFVGGQVSAVLRDRGHSVRCFDRRTWPHPREDLGNVIYAIGMTANFRELPMETADAHVGTLLRVMQDYRMQSFSYLSSTRVYAGCPAAREEVDLKVNPNDPGMIYNLTKLAGEAICLAYPSQAVRVLRLSNVLGPGAPRDTFLPSLIDEARRTSEVVLRSTLTSAKDYIDVGSVCSLIESIALRGKQRLYNVASGVNTSNAAIADLLQTCFSATIRVSPGAPVLLFPVINVDRISNEFGHAPPPFAMVFKSLLH